MKILLAFDSFKHCLRAREVCCHVHAGIAEELPDAEILDIPLADGGEGTVEAACSIAGKKPVMFPVTGPLGERRDAPVLLDGDLAIMEVASACGIEFVPPEKRNPLVTSTYGVGELLNHLLARGVRRCVVGLGGSATVDGGIGMLRAMGARFSDAEGKETTELMQAVSVRDLPQLDMEILLASDVDNLLTGPRGAARVFGPQKGATPEMAADLDRALARYRDAFGAAEMPGDGAAGGLGFAFRMLGAQRTSGAEWMLEYAGFDQHLKGADLVITGEGRSDDQTADGKLPWITAGHAEKAGVPAMLLSGALGGGSEILRTRFAALSSLASGPATLEECILHAPEELFRQGRNLAALIVCLKKNQSGNSRRRIK